MKPAPFTYARARDLAEAFRLHDGVDGEARYIAGGQTLGPMLNLRLTQPDHLIDISRLGELREAAEAGGAVTLGAGVTHAEIEDRRVPDPSAGLMARAAQGLAYRAVRNRGTLGGSVAHADPVAEWPNVLLALDARVLVRGAAGAREVALGDFFRGYLATALEPGEIVIGFAIPRLPAGARTGFAKFCRKSGEFAHSLAVTVVSAPGRARSVLGCAAGAPLVLPAVSALAGGLGAWRAGAGVEVAAALDEDLAALGVAADPFERRTHAATIERSMRDALQ